MAVPRVVQNGSGLCAWGTERRRALTGVLNNKVILVIGGSAGIGKASVSAFVREGAQVIVASRSVAGGAGTSRLVTEAGGRISYIRTDVTRVADVEALVARSVQTFGRIDCAFNNAGVEGEGVALADSTDAMWDSVINTNLKGVWLCMKYELRQMLIQGAGVIVNTSSVLGQVANRSALYTASKHGVNGLTKSAALAYAKSGIRINAVCPGYILTPMVERAYASNADAKANAIARHPIGRFGTPEEVAEAVVWLFSDSASFVTGLMMNVDGGYSVP